MKKYMQNAVQGNSWIVMALVDVYKRQALPALGQRLRGLSQPARRRTGDIVTLFEVGVVAGREFRLTLAGGHRAIAGVLKYKAEGEVAVVKQESLLGEF